MKLISWNVNGIRAAYNKGFNDFFDNENADIFCIQETKMQEGQLDLAKEGYYVYLNSAEKKGYSGTAIWTKIKPITVKYGIDIKEHDKEGRVITLEFEKFFMVNVYTPNAKRGLERLEYRIKWEKDFRLYLESLRKLKPIILCGDLNVAHKEIDLKNPKTNTRSAGFTIEERNKFTLLLENGYTDTFRHFYPDKENIYSWWSYRMKAREKNTGWRIDYFVTSNDINDLLVDAKIHSNILGSDHCPVELLIRI